MISVLLAAALTCGTEQQAQKVLADELAVAITWEPAATTVEQLRAMPVRGHVSRVPGRRSAAESYVVQLQAEVVGAKLEADGDYHVVIRGIDGKTMIVEFPADECLTGSVAAERIRSARAMFLSIWGLSPPTPRYRKRATPSMVRLTGVIFFDKLHRQTGVAPNAVEIHPCLSIEAVP